MRRILSLLLFSFCASCAAQVINPATQITWPRVTGSGAPTISCTGANYGQPYTDTTNNNQYVCTTSGWVKVNGGGSGCTISGSANQIAINTGGGGCNSSTVTADTGGNAKAPASVQSGGGPSTDLQYYGADLTATTSSNTAMNNALTASGAANFANLSLGLCNPIYVSSGQFLTNEISVATQASCAFLQGSNHIGGVKNYYGGAGGSGSYLYAWGSASFGGIQNMRLYGVGPSYASYTSSSGTMAQSAVTFSGHVDSAATLSDFTASYFYGNALVLNDYFTNAYLRHFRMDGIGGYSFYVQGANNGDGNPFHVYDYTEDTGLNSGVATYGIGKGYIAGTGSTPSCYGQGSVYSSEANGFIYDFSNVRREENNPSCNIGNADQGTFYSNDDNSSSRPAVIFENYTDAAVTASAAHPLVSTATGNAVFTAFGYNEMLDLSSLYKNRATQQEYGDGFDLQGLFYSIGRSASGRQGYGLEDQLFDVIPVASRATNNALWQNSDWFFRHLTDFVAGTEGPLDVVVSPASGRASLQAAQQVTAAATLATNSSAGANLTGFNPLAFTLSLGLHLGDNLVIPNSGTGGTGSTAVTVTCINAVASGTNCAGLTGVGVVVTPAPLCLTSSGCPAGGSVIIDFAQATLSNFGLEANRVTSLPVPLAACPYVGDFEWLKVPVAGSPIGAACSSSGWILIDGYPAGAVTYTSTHVLTQADQNALLIFLCSSSCGVSLPASQPSSQFHTSVLSIGSTVATVILNGGDTFNGSTTVPALNSSQVMPIWANSTVSTDYDGSAPLGGANVYTGTHVLGPLDNGMAAVYNCSSACQVSLPATQPSPQFHTTIMSIGSTVATFVLNGGDTFNGSTNVPTLNSFRTLPIWANIGTATDYQGNAPLVPGSNCTLTPASNGMTINCTGGGGGGDSITSPHSTIAIGGTSSATTLDVAGGGGEILAGATPALTATPALGTDNSVAGTLQLSDGSANAHTIIGSAATTSNTVLFPAAVPTNLHGVYCAVSSTTCTLTDTGYAYNAIPAADIASGALANGMTATTQAAGDSTADLATDSFVTTAVNNAVAGVNPAVAVLAASTANITGTYTQVGGGVGDTFTVTATGAFTLDGIAINTIGQRVLLKNQTSANQNGVYTATVVGTTGISAVFTRALDYDTPSDVNNTGAIPVQSGTANTTTSWLLTSQVTSIGSSGSSLTYAQFSLNPSTLVTSAASLTSNALMTGAGGQGAQTITTGTGVITALGVNTGSAGAVGVLIATGTAAMNTAAVASGACETVVTVSASGVATTDVIEVGFNGDPTAVTGYGASATGAVLTIYPYPTSGNVNFKVCNSTANSITPGALTLNWKVYR